MRDPLASGEVFDINTLLTIPTFRKETPEFDAHVNNLKARNELINEIIKIILVESPEL